MISIYVRTWRTVRFEYGIFFFHPLTGGDKSSLLEICVRLREGSHEAEGEGEKISKTRFVKYVDFNFDQMRVVCLFICIIINRCST